MATKAVTAKVSNSGKIGRVRNECSFFQREKIRASDITLHKQYIAACRDRTAGK